MPMQLIIYSWVLFNMVDGRSLPRGYADLRDNSGSLRHPFQGGSSSKLASVTPGEGKHARFLLIYFDRKDTIALFPFE